VELILSHSAFCTVGDQLHPCDVR